MLCSESNESNALGTVPIGLAGVRVEHLQGVGRALIATRCFEAGEIVLCEVPALQWPKETPADLIDSFLSAPASVQAAVLDTAQTCPEEAVTVPRAQARAQLALELAEAYVGARAVDLVKALLSIVDHNSHSFESGLAIFPTASKANHSCDPNCGHSTQVGSELRYYATRAIAEGQQITISYLDGAWIMSRAARQSTLLEQKFFTCACVRCSGQDRSRGVACTDAACGGHTVCCNDANDRCWLNRRPSRHSRRNLAYTTLSARGTAASPSFSSSSPLMDISSALVSSPSVGVFLYSPALLRTHLISVSMRNPSSNSLNGLEEAAL